MARFVKCKNPKLLEGMQVVYNMKGHHRMSRVREIPNWIITAASIMGTTKLIAYLN
jgi:hypothetical protein